MMRARPSSIVPAAAMAFGLLVAHAAFAQDSAAKVPPAPPPDSVASARDLYASAAYEESLAVLNRLRALGQPADQATTIEQYRAYCLLALGRSAEAQSAIETIVVANPLFRPSDDVSPRVRTAFTEVRRRMLPGIVQQRYADAKSAFDRKEYGTAVRGFSDVLAVLNDPDVGAAAGQPPLSDIRTLAGGFSELAVKAIAPPPAPAPEPVKPVIVATPPPAPAPPRIYASNDANVVPPVTIRQQVPAFSGARLPTESGTLEVIVDERGLVESATMRVGVNPSYDRQIVMAASHWRYQPAMLDGAPVKFRKIIQISFKAAN